MSRKEEWALILDVDTVTETSKALLVLVDGAEHWIPKTQIHYDSDVQGAEDRGTLIVAKFVARQKGFDFENYNP